MPANMMWTGGPDSNFSNCLPLHKAEPLRCLALRTRGGKLKALLSMETHLSGS